MPRIWLEPQEIPVPAELAAMVGRHPLVAQTLARRGITTPEAARAFLDPDRYQPTLPEKLPGLAEAVNRLADAVRLQEPICVWGDFDVDGQTATTILVSTLQALGAEVDFHIPVRETESHGVNLPALEKILDRGARVILTCDTGITAHAAAAFARSRGVDFIVTDHHEMPPSLPEALAVVTSKFLPEDHPLATLSGAGVAYKLAEGLCSLIRPPSFEAASLHDLAALGIVADIAVLTGEARYLVQRGLAALRKTDRLGLKALMETAELNPAWLTEEHIGFVIGPRLNALGRLSDANLSVEFFTTRDLSRARVIATTLEGLNARRQMMTSQVFQAAQAKIEREPALLDAPVLILWDPNWPAGIVGIVASRMASQYSRPVVLLASPSGALARGSARSIQGINITDAIAEQKDLLANFGGHSMAAGLSIEPERLPDFRRRLINTIRRMTGGVLPETRLQVDGYLTLPELSLDLAEDLQRLAPFGAGNPPLVLVARNLAIQKHTTIGRGDEHVQMTVVDENGNTRDVLWWQGAGNPLPKGRFDLAFSLRASDYRGTRDIQVEWVDARPLEAAIAVEEPVHQIEVIDYRRQEHPLAILKQLLAELEVQVWSEGEATAKLAAAGVAGRGRHELAACPALAIWTTPPGPAELQAALKQAVPDVVYLFAVDPDTADREAFLKRLAGLVKYILNNRDGQTDLAALTAATAQSELTVRKGLEWLAMRGDVTIIAEEDGNLVLSRGDQIQNSETGSVAEALQALLAESAAYRAYFQKVNKSSLLQ
jgi:single-stranded-DNA-specific exonuclease